MKLLLALLLMLLAAGPTHAAIAHLQTVSCSARGVASCSTPPTTTTNGSLFIASSAYCCAAFSSVTDSKSNSYTNSIPEVNEGTALGRQDYIATGVGGASHTFTLTGSSAGLYASLSVTEVSGFAASPLDQVKSGTNVSTSSHTSTSTSTTTQANELQVGFGSTASIATYTTDTGAGWTERTNIATDASTEGMVAGTKIVSATGTYAYTFTTSGAVGSVALISTWKEAAVAAGVRQRCVGCGADPKVIE